VNPLSFLYGLVTGARNRFYDRGIFKSHRLSRPVVSVGNISVGGSGKTPFVIMLGELLQQRGIEFDVLSRGYRRETRGIMIVDPSGTSRQFGDEPLLIAQRLGCPVIVGESRYQAGKLAEANSSPTNDHVATAALGRPPGQPPGPIHILDDGFQHRSLARDFDIVLLTEKDVKDRLLPAGRLREPLTSVRRADAVVLTEEIDPNLFPVNKTLWHVRRTLAVPNHPKNPVAFCGIAHPRKFVEQLRNAGIQPIAEKFYRDHHQYTSHDVQDLLRLRDQNHADAFITTEKDAINLGTHLATISPVIARVEMGLIDPAGVLDTIFRIITDRRAKA
jgi:tetraacyldisaccharide 4'-kinase